MSYVAGYSDLDVAHYTCLRIRRPPAVDGCLDDPAWRNAPRSPRIVDMVTGRPGFFDTHLPECFTRLHFSDQYVEDLPDAVGAFTPDRAGGARD